MKVVLPAIFTKPVFKADGSVKLEFETREFNGQEATVIMEQRQKEGWLLFSPNKDMDIVDIPDERADAMTGQKTQAQRLRAVMFRLWEQKGKKGDFESYYRSMMEKIIEQMKEKLDG